MVQQLVLVTFAVPLDSGAGAPPPKLQACWHDTDIAKHRFRIFVAGGFYCLLAHVKMQHHAEGPLPGSRLDILPCICCFLVPFLVHPLQLHPAEALIHLLAGIAGALSAAADNDAVRQVLATLIPSAFSPPALGNATAHPLPAAGRQVSAVLGTRALQEHQCHARTRCSCRPSNISRAGHEGTERPLMPPRPRCLLQAVKCLLHWSRGNCRSTRSVCYQLMPGHLYLITSGASSTPCQQVYRSCQNQPRPSLAPGEACRR